MSKFKVGYKGRFVSPKVGHAEIIKILKDVNYQLLYEFDGGVCPNCDTRCKIPRTFNIDKLLVLKYEDGTIGYKGLEAGDDENIIRMPESVFHNHLKADFDSKVAALTAEEFKHGD